MECPGGMPKLAHELKLRQRAFFFPQSKFSLEDDPIGRTTKTSVKYTGASHTEHMYIHNTLGRITNQTIPQCIKTMGTKHLFPGNITMD